MYACLEIFQSVTSQISTLVSPGSVTSHENCPVPAESAMPKVDIKKAFWHMKKASFSKGMYVTDFICTQSFFLNIYLLFFKTNFRMEGKKILNYLIQAPAPEDAYLL